MEKHNSFFESLKRPQAITLFFNVLIWIKKTCKLSSSTERQYEFWKAKKKKPILTNFEDAWDEDLLSILRMEHPLRQRMLVYSIPRLSLLSLTG